MSRVLIHSRGRGNPSCLHCILHRGIERWVEKFGERSSDGHPILDMSEAIAKLAEVMGELVHMADSEAQKLQFERYARSCLEAAFTHQRTGELVPVDTGTAAKGH